jgi:calcineurin-like phosphoesterase family protein
LNWFTSDLHFNHENIIKYCSRPFESLGAMNDSIIERWNETVKDEDTVYVVGDVFLGDAGAGARLVRKLRGKKVLIKGNHDRSHRTMLESGFDEVWQRKSIDLSDGRRALLCHKPLPEAVLDHVDLQVHGHRHEGPIVNGKRVNVCVDLWGYRPIAESEICSLQLGPQGPGSVHAEVRGDMVEIKASVKREDLDGLLDHLQCFSRDIWDNKRKE